MMGNSCPLLWSVPPPGSTLPRVSWDRAKRGQGDVGQVGGARGGPGLDAVGKRTLTMDLPIPPPQAAAQDHGAVAAEAVQRKSAGSPLASEVRSKVEPALGTDLGDVRVHNDPAAHSASAAL